MFYILIVLQNGNITVVTYSALQGNASILHVGNVRVYTSVQTITCSLVINTTMLGQIIGTVTQQLPIKLPCISIFMNLLCGNFHE